MGLAVSELADTVSNQAAIAITAQRRIKFRARGAGDQLFNSVTAALAVLTVAILGALLTVLTRRPGQPGTRRPVLPDGR